MSRDRLSPVPTFVVDSDTEHNSARLALADLRRMVRVGKVAERALKRIQEEGYCDGPVPLLEGSGFGGVSYTTRRLCKRPEVSRANLPDFNRLEVSLGRIGYDSWGGRRCKVVDIWFFGPQAVQINDGPPKFRVEMRKTQVGQVRINKNTLTWVTETGTFQIYKDMKHVPAQHLESIGEFVARKVIQTKHGQSAMLVLLREGASKWLVEDGHIQRWMQELRQTVPVLDVMEA